MSFNWDRVGELEVELLLAHDRGARVPLGRQGHGIEVLRMSAAMFSRKAAAGSTPSTTPRRR